MPKTVTVTDSSSNRLGHKMANYSDSTSDAVHDGTDADDGNRFSPAAVHVLCAVTTAEDEDFAVKIH